MDGKTHAIAGYTAGVLLVLAQMDGRLGLPAPEGVLPSLGVVGLAILGALAPDIDMPRSKAGSRNTAISRPINILFGHRTITHAPFIWASLYAALVSILGNKWQTYILSFVIGAATHILLDLLNKAGVPLLWPIPHRFRLFGIKTNGTVGRVFSLCIAFAAAFCSVCLVWRISSNY